ncbi:MAG: hypothetical protein M1550_05030 [Deltaproteobacteria bacterium]|nr:hypothetical protein [Deltaproteobacteria bacterium]
MLKRGITAVLAAGLLLLGGAAVSAAEKGGGKANGPADKAKALFEKKCSICHPTSRALGRNKNAAGWTATVKRMQKVNGCPITDEEAKEIAAYLTRIRGEKRLQ